LNWSDLLILVTPSTEGVILAAILCLLRLQVASHAIGQQGNLAVTTTQQLVESVCDGEMVHRVYEVLSRGTCRVVDDGHAKPTTV
jgi:hypothetical protein